MIKLQFTRAPAPHQHCPLPNALQDSVGCTEMCGDGSPFVLSQQRWQGVLSLPRRVRFDPATGTLTFFPVKEIEALRLAPPLYPASLASKPQPHLQTPLAMDPDVTVTVDEAEPLHAAQQRGVTTQASLTGLHAIQRLRSTLPPPDPLPLHEENDLDVFCRQLYAADAPTHLVPEQRSSCPKRRQLEIRASFGLEGRPWQPEAGEEGPADESATFQAGVIILTGEIECVRMPATQKEITYEIRQLSLLESATSSNSISVQETAHSLESS